MGLFLTFLCNQKLNRQVGDLKLGEIIFYSEGHGWRKVTFASKNSFWWNLDFVDGSLSIGTYLHP